LIFQIKKNLIKRKNSTTNKKPLTIVLYAIVLYAIVLSLVFSNSIDSIFGISNQNNSQNLTTAPDNTSDKNKYCGTHDCSTICNDLRQAFANGDGEKIKTITETYSGSGEHCGY
jgi:hypothetical protein